MRARHTTGAALGDDETFGAHAPDIELLGVVANVEEHKHLQPAQRRVAPPAVHAHWVQSSTTDALTLLETPPCVVGNQTASVLMRETLARTRDSIHAAQAEP